MIGSAIQWCDDTVNPVAGCDGCELYIPAKPEAATCYAFELTTLRRGHSGYPPAFDRVTLFPGRMEVAARPHDLRGRRRLLYPWRDGMRRMIFVSDMGDTLSAAVSFEYLATEIVDVVSSPAGSRHIWQWLTKRPRRMAEFSGWLQRRGIEWPANLWAGTSITSSANLGRADDLYFVGDDATTRFISLEPQRERVDPSLLVRRVAWIVQGGESGKHARPFDLAWARELRDACGESGTAYFLKQLGARPSLGGQALKLTDRHGGDWHEWPEDLMVRQFPEGVRAVRSVQ